MQQQRRYAVKVYVLEITLLEVMFLEHILQFFYRMKAI